MDGTTIWTPGADWVRVADAGGAATQGVWRVKGPAGRWIVKRILHGDDAIDMRSFRWWRREVEVALSGISSQFQGLSAPAYRIKEDGAGVTLWSKEVAVSEAPAQAVACALGRFTTTTLPDPGWFVVGRLRERLTLTSSASPQVLKRGVKDADAAQLLLDVWERRESALAILDGLPQLLSHGDALPRNLVGQEGAKIVAIDWDQLGYAPIGADLATYALWSPMPIDTLIHHYVAGRDGGDLDVDEARIGTVLSMALIATMRVIRTVGTPHERHYRGRMMRALPALDEARRIIDAA